MLFLGTRKYPVENEFTQFLTQNGGSYNAYTANDHTNYYFSIKTESLASALDRYSIVIFLPFGSNKNVIKIFSLDLLNFSLNHYLQKKQLKGKFVLSILNMKKMLLMIFGV